MPQELDIVNTVAWQRQQIAAMQRQLELVRQQRDELQARLDKTDREAKRLRVALESVPLGNPLVDSALSDTDAGTDYLSRAAAEELMDCLHEWCGLAESLPAHLLRQAPRGRTADAIQDASIELNP